MCQTIENLQTECGYRNRPSPSCCSRSFPIMPSVAHAVDSWKSSYSYSSVSSFIYSCGLLLQLYLYLLFHLYLYLQLGCVSVMQVPVLSLPLACVACVKMFAHQNPSIENSSRSRCCSCSLLLLLLFRMRLGVGLGLQLLLENAHFYEGLSICVIDKLS